ncbi:MAG: hypothetical protein WAU88_03320 [Candidatus Zixiibacteriota bacterium]
MLGDKYDPELEKLIAQRNQVFGLAFAAMYVTFRAVMVAGNCPSWAVRYVNIFSVVAMAGLFLCGLIVASITIQIRLKYLDRWLIPGNLLTLRSFYLPAAIAAGFEVVVQIFEMVTKS